MKLREGLKALFSPINVERRMRDDEIFFEWYKAEICLLTAGSLLWSDYSIRCDDGRMNPHAVTGNRARMFINEEDGKGRTQDDRKEQEGEPLDETYLGETSITIQ